MKYSYLLSVCYNGKTHQVDYCPCARELPKCVRSFDQLIDELESEFSCERIVMCAHNSIDELLPIRNDSDLLSLVSHLPNRGNLSITATGRKLSKQDLKLRKFNTLDIFACLTDIRVPLFLSPPAGYGHEILLEIRKSRKKLKERISVNKRAAVAHYCAGSLEELELLASELANVRAEADALGMLATSLETLGSVTKGVAVPHRSFEAAIQTIRHAAEYMNIVGLTKIVSDIASPWFTELVRVVMPNWDTKPSSDSNQAFLEKLNVMESATPNAVNREMVLIAALGALKLWMKLMERQYVNSGYVSETSEIVLNPRSSSEASQSTRNFLEQLAHGLILDEPPITGVSLELNPGVCRQVRAC